MAAPAGAGPTGWAHQVAGFQSNGAVTIKSLAGGSYAGTQNATGAVAKASQSAVTQPPTIIVQATAALPIKAVGDTCAASTSGAAPSQTSGEGIAILADRSSLLTCQSGVWTISKSSSASSSAMGLPSYFPTGIVCNNGSVSYILNLNTINSSCTDCATYVNQTFSAGFNRYSGSYVGGTSLDCSGMSIQQLNSLGRTF